MFDDDHYKYDFTHRLQLTFDKKLKNFIKRYSLDTCPRDCDILLGQKNECGIDEFHFCITFDDIIDDEKHFILKNSSINGTTVNYNDQAIEKIRHHFT